MFQRRCLFGLAVLALTAWAQTPPTTYSVTESDPFGEGTLQIYRDGQKVVLDRLGAQQHIRSLYDLAAHTTFSWNVDNPAACSNGTFSGDWGDPFSSEDVEQLIKANGKRLGTETVAGIPSDVWEAIEPSSKTKVKSWRDPKTGLYTRLDATDPATNKTSTVVEVKQFSLAKPSPALFEVPEPCTKNVTPAKLDADKFAEWVGGAGADYEDATQGPASPDSCTMLLRLVDTNMQPLANLQVGLDLMVDIKNPANYTTPTGPNGRTVFTGGHIQEYTSQVHDGLLRLDNVPDHFYAQLTVPNGGASALIYRHCSSPQTVLLFVVKNRDRFGLGAYWMWAKTGKFAAAQH